MFCNVIVTRPFDRVYTYKLKKGQYVKEGTIVSAPFGKKKDQIGMVIELIDTPKPTKNFIIKEIEVVFNDIILNKKIIKFIHWINDYTLAPIGSVLKLFLINENIIFHENVEQKENIFNPQAVKLNHDQRKAANIIKKLLSQVSPPLVLEGVTGSGKTEVFFEAVENIIKKKQQVLIMVPEISLTPQLEERFFERFGFLPDIWHSKISDKKRKNILAKHKNGLSSDLLVKIVI